MKGTEKETGMQLIQMYLNENVDVMYKMSGDEANRTGHEHRNTKKKKKKKKKENGKGKFKFLLVVPIH